MTMKRTKTDWKLLASLMRGYRRHLILAAVCAALAVAMSYAIPFVVSFTLDYVIQGIPVTLPAFLDRFLDGLGGRSYLVQNLFLCGAALFLLTLCNGLFTFLRRREVAFAAEGMAKSLRDRLYRHLMDESITSW